MSRDVEIRELFKRHGVPLDRDDIWAVQGTPVVKHRAVERLGAAMQVQWVDKIIIRCERDEAVILVSGHVGTGLEWSFGESLVQPMHDTGRKNSYGKPIYEPSGIGNYAITPRQAAYPYAMAEKRGKDRVILKLAGLHGVYSEEEADNFKQGDPEPTEEPERPTKASPSVPVAKLSKDIYIENSLERIASFESASELLKWAQIERKEVWPQYGIDPMDPDGQQFVKVYKDRMVELERMPA